MSVEAPSLSLPRCRGRGDPNDRYLSDGEKSPNLAPSPAKRGRVGVGVFIALVLFPLTAHAVTPGERLADPALEARARAIASELRCLVCQNQSIDDSDASLAKDLRVLVREKLKEGMSDAQVREFVHCPLWRFRAAAPADEARHAAALGRAADRAARRRRRRLDGGQATGRLPRDARQGAQRRRARAIENPGRF